MIDPQFKYLRGCSLEDKPHIIIVTRDRCARYAKDITNGASNATQVTDRWHLLKNMDDALRKLLERKCQDLRSDHKSSDPIVVNNGAPVIVIKHNT